MALNLSQKQEVVAELAEVASKAHSLVAAEYAGTTVSQMTAMRKKARETGVFLKVVKNTLAARAVEGTDFECIEGCTGRSAAVRVLVGRPRRCRASDQGIRQDQRQAAGKGRFHRRQALPGRARRGAGLAADPRTGPGHAGRVSWPSRPPCSPAPSRPWPTSRVAAKRPQKLQPRPRRPKRRFVYATEHIRTLKISRGY